MKNKNTKKVLRSIAKISFVFMLLFVFNLKPALAASIYNVTEATATVGASTSLTIQYTVDTAEQTWLLGETLGIQLPANFPNWTAAGVSFTAEYDTDTINDTIGETAITAGVGNGQYAIAGDTLNITWDPSAPPPAATGWGAPINGSSTIRVLITGEVPTYSNATSTFTFKKTTTIGTDTVNVGAANPSASIDITHIATVGTGGTLPFSFSPHIQLSAGSYITITFPANFNISAANTGVGAVTSNFTGTPTFTASILGQNLILTANGTIPVEIGKTITIPAGMVASYKADASTITVTVNDSSGNLVSSSAAATIAATSAGALSLTSATLPLLVVSTKNTLSIGFTTVNDIPADGKIIINLPSGVGFNGSYAINGVCTGLTGTWTTTGAASIITLTRSGGGPGISPILTVACTIDNITNPAAAVSVGTFTFQTTTSAGNVLDEGTALSTQTIVAVGALTGSVQHSTLVAGQTGTATISFSTINSIPNGGKVVVTFPAGFEPSGANALTATSLSGLNGTWTASVSGQVITFTQSSGSTSTAGSKSFTIAGIHNPTSPGSAGTYSISTQTPTGETIDTNASVTANTITAAGGASFISSGSSSTSTTTPTTTPPTTQPTTTPTEPQIQPPTDPQLQPPQLPTPPALPAPKTPTAPAPKAPAKAVTRTTTTTKTPARTTTTTTSTSTSSSTHSSATTPPPVVDVRTSPTFTKALSCIFPTTLRLPQSNISDDRDTDGDGVSDVMEIACGTNPNTTDTDRDGKYDGVEIFQLGTDPTNPNDPRKNQPIATRVNNLFDGVISEDKNPLITGSTSANSLVEITIKDDKGQIVRTQEIKADANGGFLYVPAVGLPDGNYTIETIEKPNQTGSLTGSLKADVLGATNANNVITAVNSKPVHFTISAKTPSVTPPSPKKLAEKDLTDEIINSEIKVKIVDKKPVLSGKTGFGSEVKATYQSVVLTSALIADSTTGDFSIQPSESFETGDHTIYVQSIRPSDGTISKTVKVSFNIAASTSATTIEQKTTTFHGASTPSDNTIYWVIGGAALIVVVGGAYAVSRRKKTSGPSKHDNQDK